MSGAYRESAAVTRVPLREIAWRRRVGWGAGWLVVFLVLGRTLWFVCAILRAPHAVLAAADLLGHLAVLAATWMLTAPRPDERAGRLANSECTATQYDSAAIGSPCSSSAQFLDFCGDDGKAYRGMCADPNSPQETNLQCLTFCRKNAGDCPAGQSCDIGILSSLYVGLCH